MNRLTIFGTVVALIAVWLFLTLRQERSPAITSHQWLKPDEAKLKGCFPWSIYYLQSLDYQYQSVICRGNLRSSSHDAYRLIKDNVEEAFSDRFLVLLQPETYLDQNVNQNEDQLAPDQSNQKELKSIFVIVPNFNPQIPFGQVAPKLEWLVWISSVLIGLLLLRLYGLVLGRLDQILAIVPILSVVLIFRELARRWVANRYEVKVSLPFFTPQLGGLVWYKSHVLDRKILFDLAIAPNLVSIIAGIGLIIGGMLQPTDLGLEFEFKVSLLMSGLHRILPNSGSFLNPLAYAGWWCLNLTALSLIPVSILDGAYILRSMVGATKMAIATPIMRIVVLGLGLVSQKWLIIAAMELFLLNYPQSQPLNDVTELNLGRDILGIIVLGFALMVILPVPNGW